jgi:hypothetical protein
VAVGRARTSTILFAVAAAISAVLLLALGSHLIFFLDDWDVLLNRRGFSADSILRPHGENIAVGPVLVYKALQATLGMDSAFPYRVVSVGTFIASVALLFVYLRRRVGEWPALAGAIAILFLGAAWEDLLWSFQVGYFGSMAGGLGALLALERQDRTGDITAAALLTVSVAFSSLGLPFLAGVAVAIGLGPRDAWPRRWLVAGVPAALFALWWLGWGREADTTITGENVATAPLFLFEGFASSISSLVGLATPRDELVTGALAWGRPLLIVGLALAAWVLWRRRTVEPWLIVVVVIAAVFWLLAGINEKPGRDPLVSRYQYIGAILVLMIAAELFRGQKVGRGALAAIFAVLAIAVPSNVNYLDQAYRVYKGISDTERADLAALELARGTVEDGFQLTEDIAQTAYVGVVAGPYFSAIDAFGSPAFSEAELAEAPAEARRAADTVLAAALGLRVDPAAAPPDGAACSTVQVDREGAVVDLPPGGAVVVAPADAPVSLRLRRFADVFGIGAGELAGGGAERIVIPPDLSSRPWQLQLTGTGTARVCEVEGE